MSRVQPGLNLFDFSKYWAIGFLSEPLLAYLAGGARTVALVSLGLPWRGIPLGKALGVAVPCYWRA